MLGRGIVLRVLKSFIHLVRLFHLFEIASGTWDERT